MLRRRLLVLPVLAALVLTGCSGGDPIPPVVSSTGPAAADLVRTAAAGTTVDGSSKFTVSSTTAIAGREVTFQGEGAYDYTANNGQLRFDVPGADGAAAGGGSIEQRIVGPDLFLTLPQQAGVFYQLKLIDVAGTSLGNSTDPTAALQALASLTEAEVVGTEEVRGVATTHYRGTYDVQAAIAGAEGVTKTILESSLGAATQAQIPFEVNLDAQGRVVRFAQEIELPASDQNGGQVLTSRTVLELFEFGTVVTVVTPPAADIRDGAPLLAALRAALPQPSAAPSPAASPAPASPSPAAPAAASPSPVPAA